MGDAGALVGTGVNFMSDRIAEIHQARQRDIDRGREDAFNAQQQRNWQTQFDYQKNLNNQLMDREDNAVRRSIADHQAAGVNKLLALGNQAAASSLQTFGGNSGGQVSEHRGGELFSRGVNALDTVIARSQIAKTKAETDYTNQKTLTEVENTENMRIKNLSDEYKRTTDRYQRKLIMKQIKEAESRIDTAYYNLGLSERRGIRTNDQLDSRALTVWALGNEFANRFGDKALKEAENWFGDGNNGFGKQPTPQNPGQEKSELQKFQNEIWDFGDAQEDDTDLLDKLYKKFKDHKFVKDMNEKKAKAYLMNLYVNKVK